MKLENQQPQVQIDLKKDTTLLKCDNKLIDTEAGIERDCNGTMFAQAYELRKLSALVSPNGQETLVPVQVFACEKCGHVNSEFSDVTGIQ